MLELKEKEVDVEVYYGMAAACQATFEESEIEGLSGWDLLGKVTSRKQDNDHARRAARVLDEVTQKRRPVDMEITYGKREANTQGTPSKLDDIIFKEGDQSAPRTDKLTIQLSEPYVGG